MDNLDLIAARHAQHIVRSTAGADYGALDSLATKALGVLQENGVYAATLFLYSRTNKKECDLAPAVRRELMGLTAELHLPTRPPGCDDPAENLAFVSDGVANDLQTLLLVKQLWEQTLIYVRYGAKAGKGDTTEREVVT